MTPIQQINLLNYQPDINAKNFLFKQKISFYENMSI